jgi:aspartate aminotransferase
MNTKAISNRIQNMAAVAGPILQFVTDPQWEERRKDPDVSDFMLGNPHDFPLQGLTAALQQWAIPQNKDWFAYKMSEPRSQEIVAAALQKSHGLPFEPADILMTTGAFPGLSASLGAIIDPGDEIIYISPPWFFYGMMVAWHQGRPVRVQCDPATFDLDIAAIRQTITSKTRGIIINSPNNPTGRIYPPATLRRLAEVLTEASQDNQRPIYLLSDEAYSHIVFDNMTYPSPTAYYAHTFLIYTYGKTLLAPGQRMGYIALPPAMPDREIVREGLVASLFAAGYTFPNALLQHALGDLQKLSIDVRHLQAKRDRLANALRQMGYELKVPEGTFYLLVRSPLADDMAFINMLAELKILCLPGAVFEMPGYFRISLTANDAMIDRALPGFEQAIRLATLPAEKSPTRAAGALAEVNLLPARK